MLHTRQPPHCPLTPEILRLVAALDECKGQWTCLGKMPPHHLAALEHHALVQGTAAGLRLIGEQITDQEVAAILVDPASGAGRANGIAAHAKVLQLLTSSSTSIPFTQHHIKQLHRVLVSSGTAAQRGQYRPEANEEIGRQMHQLVTWTSEALDDQRLHPLLVVGMFLLRFVAIRPFAEDNQRLARLLALLLLLKSGYDFIRYYALGRVIEEHQALFASGLATGRQRLAGKDEIAEEWLLVFLRILHHHQDGLHAAMVNLQQSTARPALEQQILDLLRRHGQATNKTIQTETGVSRNTIKARLRRMVTNGEIVRHGTGKGSRYTLAGPA